MWQFNPAEQLEVDLSSPTATTATTPENAAATTYHHYREPATYRNQLHN